MLLYLPKTEHFDTVAVLEVKRDKGKTCFTIGIEEIGMHLLCLYFILHPKSSKHLQTLLSLILTTMKCGRLDWGDELAKGDILSFMAEWGCHFNYCWTESQGLGVRFPIESLLGKG